jgi:formate dehydrogenase accessory protein FdhE
MSAVSWPSPAQRVARARHLASVSQVNRDALEFYADLATHQQTWLTSGPDARKRAASPATFMETLDLVAVTDRMPDLLAWLEAWAPAGIARTAGSLRHEPAHHWATLVDAYLTAPAHDVRDLDDERAFLVEALLQPFAEAIARDERWHVADGSAAPASTCGTCGGRPVVATLRERAHGASRALVCGLCLTETPTLRVTCPACREVSFDALAVYRADEIPGVQVDTCAACRTYIKTFDLSAVPAAVPVVDDLATIALDLWAQEQGYCKIRPNLLRM